jgi:carbon-monoxide dehydrogenase medium subunit
MRGDTVAIGALTRHRALERSPLIAEKLPVMKAAMRHVAHVAIRNRGTIGGSLSHADPAAELPMLALFYGATIVAQGANGRRSIAAEDFFVDALTTCLAPEEIVVEIEFPLLAHDGWGFEEMARRFGDFALASIAVAIRRSGDVLDDLRVAAMGVGDTPLRLRKVEDQLRGAAIDEGTPERLAQLVSSSVSPNGDIHASADYRRHLAGVLAKRALTTALSARA